MPIVFNFLYIFLKKLKLIEPNISAAEKTLLGRRKLSGGGGGWRVVWGLEGLGGSELEWSILSSQPNFKDWKSLIIVQENDIFRSQTSLIVKEGP